MTRDDARVGYLLTLIDELVVRGRRGGDGASPVRREDEGLLAAIVATIRRIDDGTYGICGACGVAIGYVDLSESPTATLCVNCLSDADWRP